MKQEASSFYSAAILLALSSSVLDAEIIVTTSKIDAASPPTVSSVDLAQTEFLSSSGSGGGEAPTNSADLFNGIVGTSSSGTGSNEATTLDNTSSITVDFDISTNTDGYDITQIDSFFGWSTGAGGRANQGYEVVLTFVDTTTATLVGPTHWEPNSPANYFTKVSFAESGGGVLFSDTVDLNSGGAGAGSSVLATKVKSITFNFSENAPPGGVVVGREIDIFGSPTVDSTDAFVNVGPGALFATAPLSTDKTSNFRLGGVSDDSAIVTDLDGLSVVMGAGSHHVIDIEVQGSLAAGIYPLIDYDGTIGGLGFAGLQLGSIATSGRPYVGSLVDNAGDTRVDLSITSGGPAAITWNAATDSVWDLDTTENWEFTSGGAPTNFIAADDVLFDDTAPSTTVSVSGTIEPGSVIVDNSTQAYTFNGDPISGSASVTKQGTESLTFNNANDFSGGLNIEVGTVVIGEGGALGSGAITNDGTIDFDITSTFALSQVISGTGSLIQDSSGSLTLSGANTYSGNTMLTSGILIADSSSAIGTSTLTLAGGALQTTSSVSSLSNAIEVTGSSSIAAGGNLSLNTGSITGAGTLSFGYLPGAGVASVSVGNGVLNGFTGTISHVADAVDGNQNNLNLGNQTTAATLHTTGDQGGGRWVGINGSVEVGALTGDGGQIGTFSTGAGETLTINQSIDTTYGGLLGLITAGRPLAINKTGSGTLTLTNANTYRGNTTVDGGTLTIADGGRLTFVPGDNAVTNQALGTGTLNLDGEIFFNLGGSDLTDGNSWLIVDVANLTESFGGTFSVNSTLGAFTDSSGTWTLVDGDNNWTFEQSTGVLSLALSSTPFEAWATGGETFDGDGNGDGVQDGLAFLLGAADPSTDANGLLPATSENGSGGLVMTFSMLNAANRGASSLATQHSFDLGATDDWAGAGNQETIPETTSVVGVVDFVITPNGDLNDVVATIPGSEGAAGKLFGRLLGTE